MKYDLKGQVAKSRANAEKLLCHETSRLEESVYNGTMAGDVSSSFFHREPNELPRLAQRSGVCQVPLARAQPLKTRFIAGQLYSALRAKLLRFYRVAPRARGPGSSHRYRFSRVKFNMTYRDQMNALQYILVMVVNCNLAIISSATWRLSCIRSVAPLTSLMSHSWRLNWKSAWSHISRVLPRVLNRQSEKPRMRPSCRPALLLPTAESRN